MARKLAKLGAEALKPHLIDDVWHKAPVAAKTAARLKKQYRLEGKEWPIPEAPKKDTKFGFGLRRKPKGHKHERGNEKRQRDIEAKLDAMPKLIADYRDSRRLKDDSLLDRLLMTPKERRMKQYRAPK